MLRGLRLRLTFLYVLVALAFTGLMVFGTLQLVKRYFQTTTDLALHYRMAQEFTLLGLPLPPELADAIERWGESHQPSLATAGTEEKANLLGEEEHELEERSGSRDNSEHEHAEEAYDGDLSSIYSLPLDEFGELQAFSISSAASLPADTAAVVSAIVDGHDLRTFQLDSGTKVRLLTYALPRTGSNPAFLQLGRPLNDQQRALNQISLAMSILGGALLLVLSAGSWWLAGRSISPAEAAWSKQQAFIANAGHELRAPLTLIRANADVALRHTRANDPQYPKLSDLLAETDHMTRLVEDLLLLSRLDTGAMELQITAIDIEALLIDLVRQAQALAQEKGIALSVEAESSTVLADPTRIRQVLLILLDNALQHTPSGGRIHVACAGEERKVLIKVSDNGTGISNEHLDHIFERFYQGERNARRGSGLGLSIAKELVEAMDGQLELLSPGAKGTIALLRLPAGA